MHLSANHFDHLCGKCFTLWICKKPAPKPSLFRSPEVILDIVWLVSSKLSWASEAPASFFLACYQQSSRQGCPELRTRSCTERQNSAPTRTLAAAISLRSCAASASARLSLSSTSSFGLSLPRVAASRAQGQACPARWLEDCCLAQHLPSSICMQGESNEVILSKGLSLAQCLQEQDNP